MTITKQTLAKMLADPRHVAILPPLQSLRTKQQQKKEGGSCRPCARKRSGLTDADLNVGLRSLVNYLASNPAVIPQVRSLLGAAELRIKYLKTSGGFVVWKA